MGFQEVIIQVGDVDEAVQFYVDVCGFTHLRTVEHEGTTVAEMDAWGQRVSLVPAGGPGVQLAIPTDNAKAAQRRLKRMKVALEQGIREVDGASWLPFADPWGNQLGYWQPAPPPDD